jgi:hypothetical protein
LVFTPLARALSDIRKIPKDRYASAFPAEQAPPLLIQPPFPRTMKFGIKTLRPVHQLGGLPRLFIALAVAYFMTSLGHFSHNAEFICEYPNLPASLTSAGIYLVWAAITSVGVLGFLLIRKQWVATGLFVVAAYASLGFDGLGHYALAPFEWHTRTANFTIIAEVVAAALLLSATVWQLVLQIRPSAFNTR